MKLILCAFFIVLFALTIGGASAALAEIWGMLFLFIVVAIAMLWVGWNENRNQK